MIPSLEYLRLAALQKGDAPAPPATKAGDLWYLKESYHPPESEVDYVMLVLGHKSRRRRGDGHTYVFMYHWRKPSLLARPCDLRDFDQNAMSAESWLQHYLNRGGTVRYLGNAFEMLPFSRLLAPSR